jgi:hypothetical protein
MTSQVKPHLMSGFGAVPLVTSRLNLVLEAGAQKGVTNVDVLKEVTAAMRAYGKTPAWSTSSTDANLPISLGLPAFSMAFSSPTESPSPSSSLTASPRSTESPSPTASASASTPP